MTLDIHKNIKQKLDSFLEYNNIPNILFYGNSGSGKKTILHEFINKIYDNIQNKNEYIMYLNCAHNKGIKYIREELKFFAKININNNNNKILIKSVILINAEYLTIDAQSALRRCIELFSKNTRFFLVSRNRDSLLYPIISRFCNIFIPNPKINGKIINLHDIKKFNNIHIFNKNKNKFIKKVFKKLKLNNVFELSTELYECGCSALNILEYIKNNNNIEEIHELLLLCNIVKYEIRNEKLLMSIILNNYLMRNNVKLENIDIM